MSAIMTEFIEVAIPRKSRSHWNKCRRGGALSFANRFFCNFFSHKKRIPLGDPAQLTSEQKGRLLRRYKMAK
jgi:hypothetical protein